MKIMDTAKISRQQCMSNNRLETGRVPHFYNISRMQSKLSPETLRFLNHSIIKSLGSNFIRLRCPRTIKFYPVLSTFLDNQSLASSKTTHQVGGSISPRFFNSYPRGYIYIYIIYNSLKTRYFWVQNIKFLKNNKMEKMSIVPKSWDMLSYHLLIQMHLLFSPSTQHCIIYVFCLSVS